MVHSINGNERPLKRRGRPTTGAIPQRLEQLLDEATAMFLECGYGPSSIDILARRAHVAKRTIYQYFGNKEKLFGAVVRRLSDAISAPLPDLIADDRTIDQVLTAFAHQLLDRVISPEAIGLQRIVLGEASRFPELAQQFYDNGPRREIAILARYLAHQQEIRVIELGDPAIAAEQFFNMVLGELFRQAVLGIGEAPQISQKQQYIETAVHLFLQGCYSSYERDRFLQNRLACNQ